MKKVKGNGLVNFIVIMVLAFAVEVGALHFMGVDIKNVFNFNKNNGSVQYMTTDRQNIENNLTQGDYIQTSGSSGQIKNDF